MNGNEIAVNKRAGGVMEEEKAKELGRLSEALQVAALNLLSHSGTRHARIRIRGTTPALYITLSEGRHPDEAEATVQRAQQEAYVAAVQDSSPLSFVARLRRSLAA